MVRLPFFILLNCLLLSQACAADTTTIAAFGDSLFAGYGLAPEDAFPAQLERKLKAGGYDVTVINDGVSGDTTAGGVSRVEQVMAQKPAAVLLELGGNDLLRAVPPAETRRNMDAIMARIKQAHVPMLVIGQKAPVTLGLAYASAYNSIFSDLASAYGAGLYPFFLEGVYDHPELMQQDGIHPTKEGAAVLVANLYPYVAALLRK